MIENYIGKEVTWDCGAQRAVVVAVNSKNHLFVRYKNGTVDTIQAKAVESAKPVHYEKPDQVVDLTKPLKTLEGQLILL